MAADVSSSAACLRHPIFESARRYRESDLAAYDPPLLREFLSTRRVLRHPDARWGRPHPIPLSNAWHR
jgi:hypothetical protein